MIGQTNESATVCQRKITSQLGFPFVPYLRGANGRRRRRAPSAAAASGSTGGRLRRPLPRLARIFFTCTKVRVSLCLVRLIMLATDSLSSWRGGYGRRDDGYTSCQLVRTRQQPCPLPAALRRRSRRTRCRQVSASFQRAGPGRRSKLPIDDLSRRLGTSRRVGGVVLRYPQFSRVPVWARHVVAGAQNEPCGFAQVGQSVPVMQVGPSSPKNQKNH